MLAAALEHFPRKQGPLLLGRAWIAWLANTRPWLVQPLTRHASRVWPARTRRLRGVKHKQTVYHAKQGNIRLLWAQIQQIRVIRAQLANSPQRRPTAQRVIVMSVVPVHIQLKLGPLTTPHVSLALLESTHQRRATVWSRTVCCVQLAHILQLLELPRAPLAHYVQQGNIPA